MKSNSFSSGTRAAVLVLSVLINLCVGSLYAWSVFAEPLAARLEALTGTLPELSIVFTIANAVGPITMIAGGFVNDRLGPRRVLLLGSCLFGVGFFLSGSARSLPALIGAYGLLLGLGTGMVYGCCVSNAVKFFFDRPGLAGGAATAAYGASSVIFPPIASALLRSCGVTAAFRILGAATFAILIVCSLLIPAYPAKQLRAESETHPAGLSWREMLRSPVFYLMLLMLCCGAFSGLMIISRAAALSSALVGLDAANAALVVSALALFNTFGRLLSGVLSDRFGPARCLTVFYIGSAIGAALLLLCAVSGQAALFYPGLALIGLCFGSVMGIYPGFTASVFGSAHNSVNYGIMFCGFAAAGYLGPSIMNGLHAALGSYAPAFAAAAALSLLGLALSLLFQRQQKRR